MAKKKKSDGGENLDWYLISIDRLKQIGLVVLILLLGGAGYWFWQKEKGNPKSNAEAAIEEARQALNVVSASKDFKKYEAEFNRGMQKLDEARAFLGAAKYSDAQGAAVEAQTIASTVLRGEGARENDAQFLTVEGDVRFQKGSSADWKSAEPRGALFNGDWVKTGERASAELIFSNGSLYTVGPNALLEIYAVFNPSTSKKTNAVQIDVGSVEVATTDDASSVHTKSNGNQVVIEPESTTLVGVDRAKVTAILNTRGSASVIAKDGTKATLTAGDKVTAAPTGTLSPVKKLSMPPALLSPADNQTFQLGGASRVEFVWDQLQGVSGYVLQVSRSRLFSTVEINTTRQKTSAAARVTEEGNFYWRVAAVAPDGDIGPFSAFRRFRVATGAGRGQASDGDTVPPALTLKSPFHMGGAFYTIAGTTEPGATVFINDEEVDVEADGSFQKLVSFNKIGANVVVIKANDAAGNQTTKNQTVVVED
jgi:hypothetical protein